MTMFETRGSQTHDLPHSRWEHYLLHHWCS